MTKTIVQDASTSHTRRFSQREEHSNQVMEPITLPPQPMDQQNLLFTLMQQVQMLAMAIQGLQRRLWTAAVIASNSEAIAAENSHYSYYYYHSTQSAISPSSFPPFAVLVTTMSKSLMRGAMTRKRARTRKVPPFIVQVLQGGIYLRSFSTTCRPVAR